MEWGGKTSAVILIFIIVTRIYKVYLPGLTFICDHSATPKLGNLTPAGVHIPALC